MAAQGCTYPMAQPQLPQPMPQGAAPPHDLWSVAGADPWAAAAAAAAATSAAGTWMGAYPGLGAGPAFPPPTYPAPRYFGSRLRPSIGAGSVTHPDPLPSSADTAQPTFAGRGGLDASQSVTGIPAEFLFVQTRKNIDAKVQLRASAGWRQFAHGFSAQQGKKECPSWESKDPGKTLR